MLTRKFQLLTLLIVTIGKLCCAQSTTLDSCGLDSAAFLNKYEIYYFDSVLFTPIALKKGGVKDPKNGFDFNSKKVAFFEGNGFVNKIEFFKSLKTYGPGPRGVAVFNEEERKESGGYDGIILLNCPYLMLNNMELINLMKTGKKESHHK